MNAWDYEWNASHLFFNGTSITPLALLSINHGFREDGSHTTGIPPWQEFSTWPNGGIMLSELLPAEGRIALRALHHTCGFPLTRHWKIELIKLISYRIGTRMQAAKKIIMRKRGGRSNG